LLSSPSFLSYVFCVLLLRYHRSYPTRRSSDLGRYLLLRALLLCLGYRAYFRDVHRLPRRGTRARRTAAIVRTNLCLLLKYLPIVDPLRRRRVAKAVRNEEQHRRAMVGHGPCRGSVIVGYLALH